MTRLPAVLLFLLLAGAAPPAPDDPPRGSSPDEVRRRLGKPQRISRQILAQRTVEQWHYDRPRRLRLVFERPRGQKPVLSSLHVLDPPNP